MASRVSKGRGTKPAPKGAGSVTAAADIDVLHPEREVVIAGRALVVREYGFVEGMQVQAIAKPFFDALYALQPQANGAPDFSAIMQVAIERYAATAYLIAVAVSPPPPPPNQSREAWQRTLEEAEAWVHTLDDAEGGLLLSLWWMANVGFFTRLLLRRTRIAAAAASPPAGPGSTAPSSAADTDAHPTTLDGLQPDR